MRKIFEHTKIEEFDALLNAATNKDDIIENQMMNFKLADVGTKFFQHVAKLSYESKEVSAIRDENTRNRDLTLLAVCEARQAAWKLEARFAIQNLLKKLETTTDCSFDFFQIITEAVNKLYRLPVTTVNEDL